MSTKTCQRSGVSPSESVRVLSKAADVYSQQQSHTQKSLREEEMQFSVASTHEMMSCEEVARPSAGKAPLTFLRSSSLRPPTRCNLQLIACSLKLLPEHSGECNKLLSEADEEG